jgi:Spy/CpxP family protein refolding chaperone
MSETNQGTQAGGTPLWRRRTFWLGGGALAGLAALGAAMPRAMAFHGLSALHGSLGHAGFGGGRSGFALAMLKDPQAAKEHAAMAVEWALRGVSGTDEQKQQARRISDAFVDGLVPLAQEHHDHHKALVRELSKPQLDRAAIERLRQQELELADRASRLALGSVEDFADVLTPEQRADLIAFARRMHGGGEQ